eukprot:364668-Chlamydomonas_euryale.AAC.2
MLPSHEPSCLHTRHGMLCHDVPCILYSRTCGATRCLSVPPHATSCNFMQLHTTSCHAMLLHATSCHFMQSPANSCHAMRRAPRVPASPAPTARGVTAPTPVTTTRRGCNGANSPNPEDGTAEAAKALAVAAARGLLLSLADLLVRGDERCAARDAPPHAVASRAGAASSDAHRAQCRSIRRARWRARHTG